MSSDRNDRGVGVELKYCEHCGGLWVRERGAGVVYCETCQPKVDDLPAARKRRRTRLPARPKAVVDRNCAGIADEDLMGFAAAGGVA
jgi:hypothetical protein